MKKWNLYREASKRVAEGESRYACDAIAFFTKSNFHPEFNELFKPSAEEINKYPDCNNWAWFGEHTERNQLARSLALLFMAELDK